MNRRTEPNTGETSAGYLRWWSRPDSRVAALSILLGAAALAVNGTLLFSGGIPGPNRGASMLWPPVLLVMFCITEGFAIHFRVRRGGHAISVTEIPMVLALFTIAPVLVVLARTVGGAVGLALLRRQRGTKLAFNTVLISLQATVAIQVFGTLARPGAGLAHPRDWLATYAAMLGADVLAVVLVTAAISLHDDPSEWRRLPSALRGLPLVVVATSIALIGALAVQHNPWALTLLVIVSCVVYPAYRGHVRQSQGHAQVEGLYAFTNALDSSLDTGQLVRVILGQIRDELRAGTAELIVPASGTEPGARIRMSGQGELDESPYRESPVPAWWAPAAAGRPVLLPARDSNAAPAPAGHPVDGIALPVPLGEGVTAILLVTDSLPDIPTFAEDHLRLLRAMANHASVSLANARLVERLRQEAAEKEHLALHDPLTDLPNRRQFHRLLAGALHRSTPTGDPGGRTAVMMMDLDRFKEINDALGHDTGDALLREVGDRLRRRLADRGAVARLGGDEFAMLLNVASPDDAIAVGHELMRHLERPVHIGHLTLDPRASIGIALAPDHGDDPGTLLRRADVAMYAAKESRSAVRIYQATDDQNTPHRLALIGDLREAVARRELLVFFQPMGEPAAGAVVGAEALARWRHPDQGFVPPDQFIPLAEHSGLIRPLTLHVLEVALRQRAAWRRAGLHLNIAVNLSPNTLLDDTLPDAIVWLLSQTGTPPAALTLEITESSLMADHDRSLATLNRLHALGVKISIDDFGTGYSSLGRLRDLPIHEVKIDKSFVQRAAVDAHDRAVVRSAVQLGHALDLHVVAEGVEDEETYKFLVQEGCDIVQGYFLSKPLPGDEFIAGIQHNTAARSGHMNLVRPLFPAAIGAVNGSRRGTTR